jgi:hypothetical protein
MARPLATTVDLRAAMIAKVRAEDPTDRRHRVAIRFVERRVTSA